MGSKTLSGIRTVAQSSLHTYYPQIQQANLQQLAAALCLPTTLDDVVT